MANTLPNSDNCCAPVCDDQIEINIPGPAGADGADGADGSAGENAFSTLSVAFTMPAELASATATVGSTLWMVPGEVVYIQSLGSLQVVAVLTSTTFTAKNLEDTANGMYASNAAPGTVAPINSKVGPAGQQGPTGTIVGTAVGAGSDLKGTYPAPKLLIPNAKGSLVVGDGTNAAALSANTAGFMLVDDIVAFATLRLGWKKIIPVTGDTVVADNRIPRLDGATGLPIPLQSSKTEINDEGAIVAVGSAASGVTGLTRGTNATDLQVDRTVNTQIAAGNRSVITGGQKNTCNAKEGFVGAGDTNTVGSGDHGAIVGGKNNSTGANEDAFVGAGNANQATGTTSAVVAGNGNIASATSSFVGAGGANVASGAGSSVVGGTNNTASAPYSSCPGGFYAVANKHGQFARASGRFAADGDAQFSEVIMRRTTTDATPTELFLDGINLPLTVPSDTTWAFQITIVARGVGPIDGMYTSEGVIRNNAGTTSVDGVTTTVVYDHATFPATPVVVDAEDIVNDALRIKVTGIAAVSIRWVARVRLVECHL